VLELRRFYQSYQRQIDSFKSINGFLLILYLILTFGIKGSLDLMNHGHYYWQVYLSLTSVGFVGSLIFFALLLLVECCVVKQKRKHR